MDQTNTGSGDNVGRDFIQNIQSVIINGVEKLYDRAEVIKEFALFLDRTDQEKVFEKVFLQQFDKLCRPLFFFIDGCMADKHYYLTYRFEQLITSQYQKQNNFKIESIEADIFQSVQTIEDVMDNLHRELERHVKFKRSSNMVERFKSADDLLKQPNFNITVILFHHSVYASDWTNKMRNIIKGYLEFWNCTQNTKVVIFINIVNDNKQSWFKTLFGDSNKSIVEDIKKIVANSAMPKLQLINHKDIDRFERTLFYKHEHSFSIGHHEKLKIGEEISLEQAVEKYEKSVAKMFIQHNEEIFRNLKI